MQPYPAQRPYATVSRAAAVCNRIPRSGRMQPYVAVSRAAAVCNRIPRSGRM